MTLYFILFALYSFPIFNRIGHLQRSLGHLGLVGDLAGHSHHGSSPLLFHPYASASEGASSSSSSSVNHGHHSATSALSPSANHHPLFLQQQQQRPQSYHRSVSSSPPGEAEGGGPIPVIEFPADDEVLHCPVLSLLSSVSLCFSFGF